MKQDGIVAKVDKARLLLAAARDASDAKRVADLARAAEVYARRQRLAEEAVLSATAIKIDAQALMGEFLAAGAKNKGAAAGGKKEGPRGAYQEPRDTTPTLADAGISKRESSDAQALAALKADDPATYAAIRAGETSLSAARAATRPQPPSAVSPVPLLAGDALGAEDRYDDPAVLALLSDLYALEGRVNAVAERLARGGAPPQLAKPLQQAVVRCVDAAERALARA